MRIVCFPTVQIIGELGMFDLSFVFVKGATQITSLQCRKPSSEVIIFYYIVGNRPWCEN